MAAGAWRRASPARLGSTRCGPAVLSVSTAFSLSVTESRLRSPTGRSAARPSRSVLCVPRSFCVSNQPACIRCETSFVNQGAIPTLEEFRYREGVLACEGVPLNELAQVHGTPLYVYSERSIRERFKALDAAYANVPHLICYAMKANDNLAIVRMLGQLGAGVDVVSGGELFRARRAGIPASRIIFAGVGKTRGEIAQAIEEDILLFNVESPAELVAIGEVASEKRRVARVSVRVNPNVDPQTHPYISTGLKKNKFGVPTEQVVDVYRQALDHPYLEPVGIQMHIGSQLVRVQPIVDAVSRVIELVQELRVVGIPIRYFDIGGGLGIRYRDEQPEGPADLACRVLPLIGSLGVTLLCEPGRFIVGSSGILLTKVLY